MFTPNMTSQWSTSTGTDKFGQRIWTPLQSIPCSVVRFNPTIKQTPVRTTQSASHMYADEIENGTVLLFPAANPVAIGDKIFIFDASLFCITSRPQYDVLGGLDHYQCTFQAQQD